MPTHCSVSTLLLVNAAHPFSAAPPDDLVPATVNASVLLRREAAEQLQRALAHIDAGTMILPIDGFRSHEAQAQLYASSLKKMVQISRKNSSLRPAPANMKPAWPSIWH